MEHKIDQKDIDEKIINYALNLSKRNIGITGPNPSVAAIITLNNKIISTGITGFGGSPHAEINAMNKISDKTILKDCNIYVTLEPCSHFGKNPPCVDEIIKHNFKRVIISISDPNPLVNSQAISKLKLANIETTVRILENKALEINKRFFKSITKNIPYITLKLATSLDGKIACFNGESKWITNSKSRKYAHYLRSQNDTILVGNETLRKDNPSLDCRVEGLEGYSPKVIILSNNYQVDHSYKIQDPIVLSTKDKTLKENLQDLSKKGINSILVEGGSKTATAFLKEGLVDEIVIFRSNKIIGGDGISMLSELEIDDVSRAISSFTRTKFQQFGDDLVESFRKA